MKLKLELFVEDDFEKGCCYDCPLSYYNYFGEDYTPICSLGDNFNTCRLEVVED